MKMTEDDLLRYLDTEREDANADRSGDDRRDARTKAMRSYLRKPYGTEQDGRSQVVASDVFDAIEGMLPDILEPFIASDKAVVFDPVGPEDEQGAEQATNACNHVFYKSNNGFMVLYTTMKDALMLRTGGVKWFWEIKRTPEFTTYKAVDEMQLAAYLTASPKATVVSKEEVEPEAEELQQAQMQGITLPLRHTVKIKVVKERGQVRVCAIPPDEIEVSKRHNSILLDDCPYVAHVTKKTLSDIKEMGYKVSIDDVKAASVEENHDEYDDRISGWAQRQNDNSVDPAMVWGWLREEYVLVDFDGDGIAERRKVVRLGQKILENVEFSHVPMACWTPYVLTHQFQGLSVTDLVEDFQRIRTDIWRAQLDNLDLANNQETVVLTDSQGNPQANIDDLLNRRPGGVLREKVPNAIRPYQQRWQGIEATPMLEALAGAQENRTGFTRYSQGLDSESLNKTATGITKIMNASQKRMKLMARIAAEAMVAPMFRGIFKTLTDYCMEKLSFRLNGTFVQYDPQEWREGYDMSINVGIGTGDNVQQQQFLTGLAQGQFALMQSPMAHLVDPQNIYNLHARMIENAGFKTPGEFLTDPKTVPPPQPQQPPPDPKIQIEQMRQQADAQKFQATQQSEQQRFQADMQRQMMVDQNRQEWEAKQKQLELEQTAQLEQMKAQFAAQARSEQMALEKYKADLDAQVRIALKTPDEKPSTPAVIVRDETGIATGVEKDGVVHHIKRDEQGRVLSIH